MAVQQGGTAPVASFARIASAAEVITAAEAILSRTVSLHNELVAKIRPQDATFHNTILPIVADTNRAACHLPGLSTLLAQASPHEQIRKAARQTEIRIRSAHDRSLMRRDIAALVSAVYERELSTPSGLSDDEDRHLLALMHFDYVRSAAARRSEEDREKLQIAQSELAKVCVAAQEAFTEEEAGGIWFERTDLDGVADHVLDNLPRDGTRVLVALKSKANRAVLEQARNSESRRRLWLADQNRLPGNAQRLTTAIVLRDEIARLLGFQHHTASKLVDKMAPSVAFVEMQLEDLRQKLLPLAQKTTNALLENKQQHDVSDEKSAKELFVWESAYCRTQLSKTTSSID